MVPDIEMRLRSLVRKALTVSGKPDPGDEISDETYLPDLLESTTLAALIVLIEEEWGFEIADEDIDPERFESLPALAGLVQEKVSSS
jgi:acyl carrier protein